MGFRLEADAVPLTVSADLSQLEAVADLSPTQRLDHALDSQSSLTDLLGAARER